MRLFGRRDEHLFRLFQETARYVVRGGEILKSVVYDYTGLDAKLAELSCLEHEADRIIQELIVKLNTSFILPFDREDAFQLVQKLGSTLDFISGIVDRMILYKAAPPNDTVREMVNLLCQALAEQEKAFAMLEDITKYKQEILKSCSNITTFERCEDSMYRNAMAYLFENEADPVKVIKYKEVYEHVEMAMDYCNDVAELITNICIKYS